MKFIIGTKAKPENTSCRTLHETLTVNMPQPLIRLKMTQTIPLSLSLSLIFYIYYKLENKSFK